MIDEKRLIKTLEEWKSEVSDVVGLKSEALLDKVIKEIGNQSIYHRITILETTAIDCVICDVLDSVVMIIDDMETVEEGGNNEMETKNGS